MQTADEQLKNKIPTLLSGSEFLLRQRQEVRGLPTGCADLDTRLFWQGIPRGALSLIVSPRGLGATSLWLETSRRAGAQKRWSLWVSGQMTLFAPALWSRGLCLKHLYLMRAPAHPRDRQFALRECLEAGIFTLVGIEISGLREWRRSLPKLKSLAEKNKVALVFLSSDPRDLLCTPQMSWVLELQSQNMIIHKSKNRPSFSLPWSNPYANLLSQLSQTPPFVSGGSLPELLSPVAVSRATGAVVRGHPTDLVAVQKFEKPA